MYGLRLANGWQLQAYLSPGHAGRNTLHLVYSDQRNGPVSISTVPVVTATQGSATRTLSILRLGFGTPMTNQFYGQVPLTAGRWTFHVLAGAPDGSPLPRSFTLIVAK